MEEGEELAALNAEADMPIEELLAMYRGRQSEAGIQDLSGDESDGMEAQMTNEGAVA